MATPVKKIESDEEKQKKERRREERLLDKELEDSFPASDPPSITQPPHTRPGGKRD